MDKDKIAKFAATSFLAVAAAGSMIATTTAVAAESNKMEKCYGVVKAGMNDCQTATASCASSATKDSQADAWVFVPEGLCDKIVGGSKKP